ncbi:MAG TPA: Dabb family protein [Chthoniobacterales bacterium]|jgi:hypothetical protein
MPARIEIGLLLAVLLAVGCGTVSGPAPHSITHIVLMWMKHPERPGDRAQLIRGAQSLRVIPGVVKVEAGRTLPPASPTLPTGVDRSFDLAVVVRFRDRFALDRFEQDPRRLAAVERYLRPLVRHYEVYNLGDR